MIGIFSKASFTLAEVSFCEYPRHFDDGDLLAAIKLTKDLHMYYTLSFKFEWTLRRCILNFYRNDSFLIWDAKAHGLEYVESG
jgi:hypothetical protein